MKRSLLLLLTGILLFLFQSCENQSYSILPDELTVEYLQNPDNLDTPSPRFGWKIKSGEDTLNTISQTAYQIICASNKENLDNNHGDLWETGKVNSPLSFNIPYAGENLNSFRKVYWKVRIWDQDKKLSEWSTPASFKMGVLKPEDWQDAHWIGLKNDSRNSDLSRRKRFRRNTKQDWVQSHPSALIRKEFEIPEEVLSAWIYISGAGYNELYINGKKTGDHVLDPGQTSYDARIFYTTYNISDQIHKGKNVAGVMLGNGFYGQNMAFVNFLEYGKPLLKAIIRIEMKDGTIRTIVTDTSWKASTGPVLFDNVYAGESYDARLEIPGWNRPGFDDSEWEKAEQRKEPGGVLVSQVLPAIKKTKQLDVIRISQNNKNTWTLDFGENISGWAKIKLNEKKGAKIQLRYAESLYKGKNKINMESLGGQATGFGQEDIYICKGAENETWEPRFTYHGFRYIEISGLSKPPDDQTVKAIFVHTDVSPAGNFKCSEELLNQMYEISKRTVLGNLHSIPEDCPHREKCGWLGDAHAVAEFSIYNFNMAGFYTKYMNDIRSNLINTKTYNPDYPSGMLVPTMVAPGKRSIGEAKLDWGVAIVFLPYYLYLYYDDIHVFQDHYEEIKTFVEYIYSFQNKAGIIENGLGDWCPPRWDRKENPTAMECHPYISANIFFYQALKIISFMAKKLNDTAYADLTSQKALELKKAFNKEYLVKLNTSETWYGSQTATIMALNAGMVPDSLKEKIVQGLVWDITVKNNYHHTTGIHGHRPYYSTLANLNLEKLAYTVLTNPEFPSQAYIVNSGLTTWPERQFEWDKQELNRSLNHPMQAGFAAFFHESILGIKADSLEPGFKNTIMRPRFIKQLDWASGYHDSPYGRIVSNWKRNGKTFEWNIEIPENAGATLYLPVSQNSKPRLNNKVLKESKDIQILKKQKDYLVLKAGSGKYRFKTRL